MALKTASCCVVWQLEFLASIVTGTVKSDCFCVDACFQSFSPLISHIIYHSVLSYSRYLNKLLPHLICIPDWCSCITP